VKGFVPVTKQALLEMVNNCRVAIKQDFEEKYSKTINSYIEQEKERCSKKVWYRLWQLPAPRFDYDDIGSIEAFSASRTYDMFEACPLIMLEHSVETSESWVKRIGSIALSEYSGEPIQIDINTFQRLSCPEKYHWASKRYFFSID